MAQNNHIIRVVELFAGVGGFRIGLEGASDAYETIWNNQWDVEEQRQLVTMGGIALQSGSAS